MNTLDLVAFCNHRLNESLRDGGASTQTLRILLDEWDVAQGTLARYPIPFSQGVVEGIRRGLLVEAYRWNTHPDWDRQWLPVSLHQGEASDVYD